ncbi:hypothetical protein UFOVP242_58 [uncultured Caudovirales phage]|uniref:Uncharacterized protein n=1 Tax=uncultured Caudovirales phage TaxID=2100421 RepID=A0A6J7WXZ4_9CAUD|nr:hypothetical protein UFOVP242_58 [uncultured Caudovirales phage]
MSALSFPSNPSVNDTYAGYIFDGTKWDAIANPITTANIAEDTNLYFTNARARLAISVTGAGSYNNTTGLITINETSSSYSDANVYSNVVILGYATNANVALKANVADLKTANVVELTNLYFTNARVVSALSTNTLGNVTTGNITIAGSEENLQITSTYGGVSITNSRGNMLIGNNTRDGVARYALNTGLGRYSGIQVQRAGTEKWFYGASDTENFVVRANNSTDILTINANGTISITGSITGYATNTQLTSYATTTNVDLKANVVDLTAANIVGLTTANVAEVTNLYFTNTRSYANVITLGYAKTANLTTANVTEVTNLYFTNARAVAAVTASSISVAGGVTANAATAFTAGPAAISGVALAIPYEGGIRNSYNGLNSMYIDVSTGGTTHGQFQFRSGSTFTNVLTMSPTAFSVSTDAVVTARTPSLGRLAWNSALDTELTVDDYRFRITNSGGIYTQVISNTGSTKNSAWTAVAAISGSAVTQGGSTGVLLPNNSWTTLYTFGSMASAGDTVTVTFQDKTQGRIYRITFMRSDNGSTTGYNIIAERLI